MAYTIATTVLGWSDEEFWVATPRRYLAVIKKYGELNKPKRSNALVGDEAIKALCGIASKLR